MIKILQLPLFNAASLIKRVAFIGSCLFIMAYFVMLIIVLINILKEQQPTQYFAALDPIASTTKLVPVNIAPPRTNTQIEQLPTKKKISVKQGRKKRTPQNTAEQLAPYSTQKNMYQLALNEGLWQVAKKKHIPTTAIEAWIERVAVINHLRKKDENGNYILNAGDILLLPDSNIKRPKDAVKATKTVVH